MDKQIDLIFVPAPGAGHLISTLEFAIRLLDHDDRLRITVLGMKTLFLGLLDDHARSVASATPRVTFIDLPHVELPPPELLKGFEKFIDVYVESHVPHIKRVIGDILSDRSKSVAALVIDLLCLSLIDWAKEFGLLSYIYLPSNVGFLGLILDLPDQHERKPRDRFDISDPPLLLPCISNPVPTSALPGALFDGEHGGYSTYVKLARGFREPQGILVNTFDELEPFDFGTERISPIPIYKVGPMLSLKALPHPTMDAVQWDGIWKWLDDQPSSSVVFLCFGSAGSFTKAQVREIAMALERSGRRFLWSLRLSSEEEDAGDFSENYRDGFVLLEGFLERTRGRGVVCRWAPQVEVLAHEAVGGFVSHCGWNSILESIWHGVPTATWPLYAEQQLNAFQMVKEWGLAVEIRMGYRAGDQEVVAADEIERAIGRLMDNGDTDVRKKVKAMKSLARNAVVEGGSSFDSIRRFIQDLTRQ